MIGKYGIICFILICMCGCKSGVAQYDPHDELWYQRAQNGSVIDWVDDADCLSSSGRYIFAGIGSSYGDSTGIRNVAILAPEAIEGGLHFQGARLVAVRKPALEIKLTAGSMYLKTQADIQEHAGDWPTDFSHYIKPGVEYRYIDFFADESWINGGFCVVVFYGKKDGSPELAFDRVLLDIKNMVVNSDAIQN